MGKKMDLKAYTSANRKAWEEAAPLHRRQNFESLKAAFEVPGHSCLDEIETEMLLTLQVAGKNVAQLCCNNGRELLSVKNLGAAHCVGFDGAEGFITQARALAKAGNIDCAFVCTDIYDIAPEHHRTFDLVTITIGVLTWMPDLPRFFGIADRLLRPGGAMFIYEQHPILDMFKSGTADDPVEWEWPYFTREPYIETTGLDYYSGGTYESEPLYSFTHTMSDVIMSGVDTGFAVEHFKERPKHISNTWYNVEHHEFKLPMSYTLVFRKPGNRA